MTAPRRSSRPAAAGATRSGAEPAAGVVVGEPLVVLTGVGKRYGDAPPALDGITLRIAPGEIIGVIGESGAGKSTLLQTINGLVSPTSGSVMVQGKEVTSLGRKGLRELRHGIGVVFQGIHLLANVSVIENVALALRLRARDHRLGRGERRRRAQQSLDFVGLGDRAGDHPAQLSGGEQQRVALARALVARPALLLCDEPTSSLDGKTAAEILRLLGAARDELGTTIVLITHDLEVVRAICDRVVLLDRGRLTDVFTLDGTATTRSALSYEEQVRREFGR